MYVGGGEAFVKRQFSYAKTWSQPGATLPPVMRLAEMRPRLPLQRAPFAQLEQAQPPQELSPPDEAGQAGAVERRILPDGSVELHYPDGTIRKLFGGGETITRPDGTTSTMLYQNAQPPTPPTAPPDSDPRQLAGRRERASSQHHAHAGRQRRAVDPELPRARRGRIAPSTSRSTRAPRRSAGWCAREGWPASAPRRWHWP